MQNISILASIMNLFSSMYEIRFQSPKTCVFRSWINTSATPARVTCTSQLFEEVNFGRKSAQSNRVTNMVQNRRVETWILENAQIHQYSQYVLHVQVSESK